MSCLKLAVRTLFALALVVTAMNWGMSAQATSSTSSATNSAVDPVQQCIDTCHAFIEQPGPELRRCVSDCLAMEAARWSNFTATKCETYEDDCDRGGDDPSNPSDPEPSDDGLF
ncbi:MAG TPA: hypothetical protein PLZ57_13485 [Pseudobdellovibrionaceae bacterium]|nr:hypothetical protein [Pseudobdellovibrionaceae bacterium]